MLVGIIGLGFVGSAMQKCFLRKGISVVQYDNFKRIGSIESVLIADVVFLCLPTPYNEHMGEYDKKAIYEVCHQLDTADYSGVVVLKSTVEPGTTSKLTSKYHRLSLIHNPEFLTARTADEDFYNAKHIVLGKGCHCPTQHYETVKRFYRFAFPEAEISECTSTESESMKIFCNSFYAVKIQFFNELFDVCKGTGTNYNTVKELMLKNSWINPMHTLVPGPDGRRSYGGECLPKDASALNSLMKRKKTHNKVLDAAIRERENMR